MVKLVGRGTDNLLRARGTGISITWVDLSGASGTSNGAGAITAGSAGSDFLVQFARIHDNASLGISNMKGRVLDSEFFKNSNATSSLGFNGWAVKGITEFEAGRVYVHDEQGNGLWCDVGCSNDPARGTKGFWVHDSVVVNSARAGIRYENSPNQATFENNEIHGNGRTETAWWYRHSRLAKRLGGSQQQLRSRNHRGVQLSGQRLIGAACAPPTRAALTV